MTALAAQQGNTGKIWLAGLLTSVAAALIMAVVVMLVFTVFLGKGPLYPVQVIGSTVFGEQALTGFHFGAFLMGLALHVGVGLAWGAVFCLFASLVRIETPVMAGAVGIFVAVISMVDSYLFVPYVMNALHGVDIWNREVPIFWNWAAHIVFGASFSLYPLSLKKLSV